VGDPEKGGCLSDFVPHLLYVNSYIALLPLLFPDYEEVVLQIIFGLVPEMCFHFISQIRYLQ
jgi:hypothetical protein